jgi:cell division transport system ATP-binding protein
MKLENVTLAFATKNILRNASLDIKPGEFIFIVGASGSGKTSLIRAITGELPPKHGQIFDDNHRDIYALSPRDLQTYRRKIGIIFQDYKLLRQRTVRENVAFAMEICGYPDDHVMKTTPEILERVGILRKKDAFIENLSGGECQRVAIARALIHNPDIIIGDEPTGNLDPENSQIILDIFLDLNKK